jgi:hypothetical protein
MDVILGAYGEAFCDGEPRPDIPDTLYRLLEDVKTVGRVGIGRGAPFVIKFWRFEAEFEVVSAGGVVPPYVEFAVEEDCVGIALAVGWPIEPLVVAFVLVVPFVPDEPLSLVESVLRSVRKLAFERLLRSLKNDIMAAQEIRA